MFRILFFVVFMIAAAIAVAFGQTPSATHEHSCHISALIDTSAALGLPSRVERALLLTLHRAGEAYHRGETQRALTLLRTFSFEVRSVKRAQRVPAETADMLTARAEDAIRYLSNAVHLQ